MDYEKLSRDRMGEPQRRLALTIADLVGSGEIRSVNPA